MINECVNQISMKAPPAGWPRISSSIFYDDAAGAITWLCDAFGFELRLKVEGDGGAIVHSELEYGGGLVMVGTATSRVDGRGAYTDDQRSPHISPRRAPVAARRRNATWFSGFRLSFAA